MGRMNARQAVPRCAGASDLRCATTIPIGSATVLTATGLLTNPAHAHVTVRMGSGLADGFLHPLNGFDHLLAMVSVGIWGAELGVPAVWLLPIAFPLIMAFGGALGVVGVPLPGGELLITLSVVVLGVLVASARRLPIWTALWRPDWPAVPRALTQRRRCPSPCFRWAVPSRPLEKLERALAEPRARNGSQDWKDSRKGRPVGGRGRFAAAGALCAGRGETLRGWGVAGERDGVACPDWGRQIELSLGKVWRSTAWPKTSRLRPRFRVQRPSVSSVVRQRSICPGDGCQSGRVSGLLRSAQTLATRQR
jgi:hypothetical protein